MVGSIWNGLENSQVKKVGRSLRVGGRSGHWASGHCSCSNKSGMLGRTSDYPTPTRVCLSLLLPDTLLTALALPACTSASSSPHIIQAEPGLGRVPHSTHGQLQGWRADQSVAGQGGPQAHTEHPLRFLKPQLVHVLLL